jgi:hypothetical protein
MSFGYKDFFFFDAEEDKKKKKKSYREGQTNLEVEIWDPIWG